MALKDLTNPHYHGPERRNDERRIDRERRQMIRWEPDQPDRRRGKNRRKSDKEVDPWGFNRQR